MIHYISIVLDRLHQQNAISSEKREEIELVLTNLERSLVLSESVVRSRSDRALARERFIKVESLLSQELNKLLQVGEKLRQSGEALDEARQFAWNISLQETEEIFAAELQGKLSQQHDYFHDIFLANVAYEILQRLEDSQDAIQDEDYVQLVKHIEFPPQYVQAGVLILNQFARIVREQFHDEPGRVRINQNGERVTMVIETLEGNVSRFEETLSNMNLVVQGKKKPEEFIEDDWLAMKTRQTLEFARMQLDHERERSLLYQGRVEKLELMVDRLAGMLDFKIQHDQKLIANLIENDRLRMGGMIEAFSKLATTLTGEEARIVERVRAILSKDTLSESDAAELRDLLANIQRKNPTVYEKIKRIALDQGLSVGAGGLIGYLARLFGL